MVTIDNGFSIQSWDDLNFTFDQTPDMCPICNYSCETIPVGWHYRGINKEEPANEVLNLICLCPRNDCKELFIARYKKLTFNFGNNVKYELSGYTPYRHKDKVFDECIIDVSKSFVDLYNQSKRAEKYDLTDIAGVGYRKALEFLIKDYAIKKNPDKKEEIEGTFLGKCINGFVDNVKIKECARRAVWIGNDETHYMRKWIDKDITDMRNLIELTIHWIALEIQTEAYLTEMQG